MITRKTFERTIAVILLTVLAVLGLSLLNMAFAQELGMDNVMEWGGNPTLAVLAVVAAVEALRKRIPAIDGVLVLPVALLVGAVGGVGYQLVGLLTFEPFALWTFPWGGLLYGLAAALTGFLGVNLFDMVTGRVAKILHSFFGREGTELETTGTDDPDAATHARNRARLR